ncbi:hypothetical protein [Streptomyces achromogenes]
MPTTVTRPRIDYPRPPVVVLHDELFVEPAYEGGEQYAQDDDEDSEPGT